MNALPMKNGSSGIYFLAFCGFRFCRLVADNRRLIMAVVVTAPRTPVPLVYNGRLAPTEDGSTPYPGSAVLRKLGTTTADPERVRFVVVIKALFSSSSRLFLSNWIPTSLIIVPTPLCEDVTNICGRVFERFSSFLAQSVDAGGGLEVLAACGLQALSTRLVLIGSSYLKAPLGWRAL